VGKIIFTPVGLAWSKKLFIKTHSTQRATIFTIVYLARMMKNLKLHQRLSGSLSLSRNVLFLVHYEGIPIQPKNARCLPVAKYFYFWRLYGLSEALVQPLRQLFSIARQCASPVLLEISLRSERDMD
jgi:hypothetical protein